MYTIPNDEETRAIRKELGQIKDLAESAISALHTIFDINKQFISNENIPKELFFLIDDIVLDLFGIAVSKHGVTMEKDSIKSRKLAYGIDYKESE